jgi:sec-independent protein translocase protein TatA
MPFGIGPVELLIVLFIVLLLFGAKKVPEMGRGLGSGLREFKEGVMNPAKEAEQQIRELEAPVKATVDAVKSEHASA